MGGTTGCVEQVDMGVGVSDAFCVSSGGVVCDSGLGGLGGGGTGGGRRLGRLGAGVVCSVPCVVENWCAHGRCVLGGDVLTCHGSEEFDG